MHSFRPIIIAVISVLVFACVSSDDDSKNLKPNPTTVDYWEKDSYYLFYQRNGGIYALAGDGVNEPIEIEPESDPVSAVVSVPHVISSDKYQWPQTYRDKIAYLREGQFWQVSGDADSSLTPSLLAVDDDTLIQICHLESDLLYDRIEKKRDPILYYSTKGSDGNCNSDKQSSIDDKTKYLKLSDIEALVSKEYKTSEEQEKLNENVVIHFLDNFSPDPVTIKETTGYLMLEDGTLSWLSIEKDIENQIILRENTNKVRPVRYSSKYAYLIVDDELMYFDVELQSLSPLGHIFPSTENFYPQFTFSESSTSFLVTDPSGVYRVSRDDSSVNSVLYKAPDNAKFLYQKGSSASHIVVSLGLDEVTKILSISRTDGEVIELASLDRSAFLTGRTWVVNETVVIAVPGLETEVIFVSVLGEDRINHSNTTLVQDFREPPSNWNSDTPYARFILAKLINDNFFDELELISVDSHGNQIASLGTIKTDSNYLDTEISSSTLGKAIFAVEHQDYMLDQYLYNLYHVDLYKDGSLMTIENNMEHNPTIYSVWK